MAQLIMNRDDQRLWLDGRRYTPQEIRRWTGDSDRTLSAEKRELFTFLQRWFDDSEKLTVQTSGSTGTPKRYEVRKDRMIESACMTCTFLNLQPGESALLCMNLRYIGAMMMVVRALVAGLHLTVRPASGSPLEHVDQPIDFAAMVPLQVYTSLNQPETKARLSRIGRLIIGGGAISRDLEAQLRLLPHPIYSTYGMTETLSHIALRRINGPEADAYYRPFSGVTLSLSVDQALVINAPGLCDTSLQTNDVVELCADGRFRVIGRLDNVINSGGIKVQIEVVEEQLRSLIDRPFAITSIPDDRLGEAVVLLLAQSVDAAQSVSIAQSVDAANANSVANANDVANADSRAVNADRADHVNNLMEQMKALLPLYHSPKCILLTDIIPLTGNGKVDRLACRKLAQELA